MHTAFRIYTFGKCAHSSAFRISFDTSKILDNISVKFSYRKVPKSDIFFGTNDRLTYFLMQFQKKKKPERKAQIAVFPQQTKIFFQCRCFKRSCALCGNFFLTKLIKNPIYKFQKAGPIEKKDFNVLLSSTPSNMEDCHFTMVSLGRPKV